MLAFICILLATGITLYGNPIPTRQTSFNALNPYPDHPRITFRQDGTFHLTVFSDLHYGENEDSFGIEQDIHSEALMRKVLADKLSDYVVLNGDLITSESKTFLLDDVLVE